MLFAKKEYNKNYDDLSLRISELSNSKVHYENDKILLKDRLIVFEALKNIILKKSERKRHNIKIVKHNGFGCGICKINIHRASYSGHLKCEKHLENMSQKNVIVPRKNPIKRGVNEDLELSDTKIENL